ncbi:MAG: NAD-dependent epimerase/dehydratase family protein [Desulfobulbaceae bacterium]
MGGSILVTGANGFVGAYLGRYLAARGFSVRGSVREKGAGNAPGFVEVGDIDGKTDWRRALEGIDVVVHLAARVHLFGREARSLEGYRQVNVEGTRNLVRQAAEAGVCRFIFVSTIKVHGEESGDTPFRADDIPAPRDWYGISKLEAEEAVRNVGAETGMEWVILRPPLVYGPGVKGNFAELVRFVRRGSLLPFGLVDNQRSLVGIDNFCDLIAACIDHPAAAGRILLAGDGEDVSTPELIRRIASACGVRPRLLPVPVFLLRMAAAFMGRGEQLDKLIASLQVDITETRELLHWSPPLSLEEGIRRCVAGSAGTGGAQNGEVEKN